MIFSIIIKHHQGIALFQRAQLWDPMVLNYLPLSVDM